MHKKLLILQFRTDVTKEHEQQCFREDLDYIHDKLEFHDAVAEDFPDDLSVYGGVIVAGSAQFMIGEGDGAGTWKDATFRFFDRVVVADLPMLGICFGYQLLALYHGARITNLESLRETGSLEIQVYPTALQDPLFVDMPGKFIGQFGHKETIIDPPVDLIPLACTDRVQLNTFRVQGKKIWGTLCHPELNPERVLFRLKLFPIYLATHSLDDVAVRLQQSPYAIDMVHNFVKILD